MRIHWQSDEGLVHSVRVWLRDHMGARYISASLILCVRYRRGSSYETREHIDGSVGCIVDTIPY